MKTLIVLSALGLAAFNFGYDWNPKQWAPYGSYPDDYFDDSQSWGGTEETDPQESGPAIPVGGEHETTEEAQETREY